MKPKTVAFLLIAVSLAFAGAIVLSSYLLKESAYAHHADTITYLWIALWWREAYRRDRHMWPCLPLTPAFEVEVLEKSCWTSLMNKREITLAR